MEKLVALLMEINDSVDYDTCRTLIDDSIFDSFDIIQTINEINSEFDVTIPAAAIVPENFNSAAAMWAMIQRLQDED